MLPINFPGKEQLEIVMVIKGGVSSLGGLIILRLKPNINSREFSKRGAELATISLSSKRAGLVEKVKVGKNVRIELTDLRKIVAAAFSTFDDKA